MRHNNFIILACLIILSGCAGLQFEADNDPYAVEDSMGYYLPVWGHGTAQQAAGASVGWLGDLENTTTKKNACQFIAGTGQLATSTQSPGRTSVIVGLTVLKCFGAEIEFPAIDLTTGHGFAGANFSIKGF